MRRTNNLPPYSADVKKSRSLNFLEPSALPALLTHRNVEENNKSGYILYHSVIQRLGLSIIAKLTISEM